MIYLVDGADILVVKPYDKVFIEIPDADNQYELIFKNENNLLKFPDVSSKVVIPQQDFEWNFGIDKSRLINILV